MWTEELHNFERADSDLGPEVFHSEKETKTET